MDTLTDRAERALLGTLLSTPEMVADIGVAARHFAGEQHARVYAAITGTRDYAATRDYRGYLEEIAAQANVPVPYLSTLRDSVPDPLHGYEYQSLVAEAAALRRIRRLAEGLADRAEGLRNEALNSTGVAGIGALRTAARAAEIGKSAYAIQLNHARFNPDAMPGLERGEAAADASDRVERRLLAALITEHAESGLVLETLPPEKFSDPVNREIYEAILGLRRTARLVDPLTVDWQIARQRGTGPQPAQPAPLGSGGPNYVSALAALPVSGHILPTAYYLESRDTRSRQRPAALPPPSTNVYRIVNPGRAPLIEPPPQAPGAGPAPEQRR